MRMVPFLLVISIILSGCAATGASVPQHPAGSAKLSTTPSLKGKFPTQSLITPAIESQSKSQDSFLNPLTGLPPSSPALLDRRPVVVKVQNVPRVDRPQWGLSFADLVYEYYIEYGDTRFAAVFYGQDAKQVGPIRSARHIDMHIVDMYKAFLIFGGAYDELFDLLLNSDFKDRLIREGPNTAPALHRYDPNGRNSLLLEMGLLGDVIQRYEMDNSRQNLEGMAFLPTPPSGGDAADQVFVRFSGGMYSRWDYDPSSARYFRFSDAADDVNRDNPVYSPLTDRLNKKQLAAENVVVLLAPYKRVKQDAEVFDVNLIGSGKAYLARDGQIYGVNWQRKTQQDVLTLVDDQGHPFPFKPGKTWFEVMGQETTVKNTPPAWSFAFRMP
jgi:hypothetical protein